MRCAVPSCSTKTYYHAGVPGKRLGKKFTYHQFPKDPHLRALWQNRLGVKDVGAFDHVCNLHFLEGDYIIKGRLPRLRPGTVPLQVTDTIKSEESEPNNSIQESGKIIKVPKTPLLKDPSNEQACDELDEISNIPEYHIQIPSQPTKVIKTLSIRPLQRPQYVLKKIPHLSVKCTSTTASKTKSTQTDTTYDEVELQIMKEEVVPQLKHKIQGLRSAYNGQKKLIETLQRDNKYLQKQLLEALEKVGVAEGLAPMTEVGKFLLRDGGRPREYTPEMRRFAVGLHTISKKAYRYVRKELGCTLPHKGSVNAWKRKMSAKKSSAKRKASTNRKKGEESDKILVDEDSEEDDDDEDEDSDQIVVDEEEEEDDDEDLTDTASDISHEENAAAVERTKSRMELKDWLDLEKAVVCDVVKEDLDWVLEMEDS